LIQAAALRLLFKNEFSIFSEILKYTGMKKFKEWDFGISVGLILFFAVASILDKNGGLNNSLITGYFVVGSWQSISMIVHTVTRYFTKKWSRRYYYHWISLVAVVTMPAGSIWLLYPLAPFMAVYYAYMCYEETFVKLKRPMELLK
jgi:hypothetical protein